MLGEKIGRKRTIIKFNSLSMSRKTFQTLKMRSPRLISNAGETGKANKNKPLLLNFGLKETISKLPRDLLKEIYQLCKSLTSVTVRNFRTFRFS